MSSVESNIQQIKGSACIIDAGDRYILQVRDNKDGIKQPGKISLWGGRMEVVDGGDYQKTMLRELAEELGLLQDEIRLTSLLNLDYETIDLDGKNLRSTSKIYIAHIPEDRFLHVYEGEGIFVVEKGFVLSDLNTSNFGIGVIETLEKISYLSE